MAQETKHQITTAGVQSGPPSPRKPHDHDSTRLDGWLDNCCMHCGGDGYWLNGESVDLSKCETKVHPSGKLLARPAFLSASSDTGGAGESWSVRLFAEADRQRDVLGRAYEEREKAGDSKEASLLNDFMGVLDGLFLPSPTTSAWQ